MACLPCMSSASRTYFRSPPSSVMVVLMPSGSKPMSPTMEPSSAGGFFRKGMAADRSTAMTGDTAADLTAAGATVGAKPELEIENMESCQAHAAASERGCQAPGSLLL